MPDQTKPLSKDQIERGSQFAPKFVDHDSREVLVVAFMNAEALEKTRATGTVHFWSRSRGELWMKGETSGNTLTVVEMRVDCDQDALVIFANPAGPTCHTGATTCFYRRVDMKVDDREALTRI